MEYLIIEYLNMRIKILIIWVYAKSVKDFGGDSNFEKMP